MALRDPYERHSVNLADPASHAVEITPSDSEYIVASRALYIGGAGDVDVLMLGGETVSFEGVPVGSWLPIRAIRVLESTTATKIVSVY